MNHIGNKVQQFYNKTPFPDYELSRFLTIDDLRLAAYPFSKIIDRSIPDTASIIDVGTGTGQLSAFLSTRRDHVMGIDFSDSSLSKAKKLKKQLNLNTWQLKKIDILDTKQIESINQQFDYVLCLGVLHHTADPYKGFQNIIKLLKPGGKIVIGLYNTYGRIPLKIRIHLAKTIFKNNNQIKDWFIRMQIGEIEDKERARGWWNDQYLHPHESTHTVNEIVNWFKNNNINYLHTVPTTELFTESDYETSGLWVQEPAHAMITSFIKQLQWIWQTHHEGGYWMTFGQKNK